MATTANARTDKGLHDMLYDIDILLHSRSSHQYYLALDIDGLCHDISTSINLSHSSHGTDVCMCCTTLHIQQKQEASFGQRFCPLCFAGCIAGTDPFSIQCNCHVTMFSPYNDCILVALECKIIQMCLKDWSLSVQWIK